VGWGPTTPGLATCPQRATEGDSQMESGRRNRSNRLREYSNKEVTLGPGECEWCGTRHVPAKSTLYLKWHAMAVNILEMMQQGIICNILAYAHTHQTDLEVFQLVDKIVDIRTIVAASDNPRALDIAGENFLNRAYNQIDDLHAEFKLLQEGIHVDCQSFTPDDIWAVGLQESRLWRSCKKFQILMRFIATDEVLPVAE